MTVLNGIDISNWEDGFDIAKAADNVDFIILKATEGLTYTDKCFKGFADACIDNGIKFGFYHFARNVDAKKEADFFYKTTKKYTGMGIPILDLEVISSSEWIEKFCKRYHTLTGVYPWVYMSSDYVNNKGYGSSWTKKNCPLWIAGYPTRYTTYPTNTKCPYAHKGWALAAWQFTDALKMQGMSVDGSFFYGKKAKWARMCKPVTVVVDKDASTLTLAENVIKGEYGNNKKRKAALGDRYDEVQAKVNDLYKKANDVLKGKYGDGLTRAATLGKEYTIIQYIVNDILSK